MADDDKSTEETGVSDASTSETPMTDPPQSESEESVEGGTSDGADEQGEEEGEEASAEAHSSSEPEVADSGAESERPEPAGTLADQAASVGEAAATPDAVSAQKTNSTPPFAHSSSSRPSHSATGHGHHGFAHITPMRILGAVLGALLILTILTVAVTAVDLGAQGNFVVAMVIATVKAALVMAYFMHLAWDSRFNVVAFTSSFLFVLLFLAMALLDRGEYQDTVDEWEDDQIAQQ